MSHFPAYSGDDILKNSSEVSNNWVSNPNFFSSVAEIKPKTDIYEDSDSSDGSIVSKHSVQSEEKTTQNRSSSHSYVERRKKKYKIKKKYKKDKNKEKLDTMPGLFEEDLPFVVDTFRDLGYLEMREQSKRARPIYEKPLKSLPGVIAAKRRQQHSKKILRYYSKKYVKCSQSREKFPEDIKQSVEALNKAVYENPTQVNNWLSLVNFQDDYYKFQPIAFKTAGERDRAVNGQKLAILERALTANPDEVLLQKMWLQLAIENCTHEEVNNKLVEFLRDRKESLVLSLGRSMLIQLSMPRCTAPAVTNTYKEAMERIERSRHMSGVKQDSASIELLLHACVFLEQCGLWEMAWMAINLTLQLNLTLEIPNVCASEENLLSEENKILENSENVPIWHLWTRLEFLRQGNHFLPVATSENFPQRVVTTEEVVGLVHHIRRSSHFRLLLLLPLLANVPLLPRSQTLLTAIMSQMTPWILDSVEWQLASVFCPSPLLAISGALLAYHLPDNSPPQYLRQKSGQREFLDFTSKLFEMALSALSGRQRVAVGVWYLRYLRWLDRLAKLGRFQPPSSRPKTKIIFKRFLMQEENRHGGSRDIILFFIEYGLWEYENGDIAGSVKTLETLVASRGAVLDQSDIITKTDLCALYRALCEVQIAGGYIDGAKLTLRRLCRATSDTVTYSKLKHIATESLNDLVDEELEDLMLPHFTSEWLSCYAVFLALHSSVEESLNFISEAVKSSKPIISERLHETVIAITKQFDKRKPQAELATAVKTIVQFPFNAVAGIVIAEALAIGGGLWWKDLTYLLQAGSGVGAVVGICSVLERQRRNGDAGNRHRALLTRLAALGNRTSVLVHRIYLATLATAGDLEGLNAARVQALEAFPWNKNLYMDAIAASPASLLPLTDLLVEKDLRIHVTPDEIEALRS